MPFQYRITKYDPINRDATGRYLKNEWTYYGDIGKTYDDEILSFDEYGSMENKYIKSIERFMMCNKITSLHVVGLEKKKNPKHDKNATATMIDVFESIKNNDQISMNIIDSVCRLILREYLWCKLEDGQKMQVHLCGDYYYMYIVSDSYCHNVIEDIEQMGLFVEKYKSPYFINNAFVNSVNIMDGVIVYNEFDIDEDWSFREQQDSLREDLLQIQFNDFLIDVGWYPSFNVNGSFVVAVIKHYDWQTPIKRFKAKSFKALKKSIEDAVLIIKHQTR